MPFDTPSRRRAPRTSSIVTRAAVLHAALAAFSDRGFDAVTTREIAAAAEIEQGHLAYYFASKDTLWRETVATFNVEFKSLLNLLSHNDADPDLHTSSLLTPLLRFFASNRPLTRLMLQEFTLRSNRHDWLVEQYGRPAWECVRPLFVALAERHMPRADPAQLYFAFLGGALLYFGSGNEVRAIVGNTADDESFISMHVSSLAR